MEVFVAGEAWGTNVLARFCSGEMRELRGETALKQIYFITH